MTDPQQHIAGPTGPVLETVADRAALTVRCADWIAGRLKAGLAAGEAAGLAVPGGRTPVPVFQALSAMDLDWARVHVTLTDERWVAPDHADSNEALVRRHLVTHRAGEAVFAGLKSDAETAPAGVPMIEDRLKAMSWPLDAVVLGMGADGHIASLFPHAEGLTRALDPHGAARVCAIRPDPLPANAPYDRISLTLAALLDARAILLIVTGEDKRAVLDAAQRPGADPLALPVAAILTQTQVPVTIAWAP